MQDFSQLLRNRRSIRAYTGQPVARETVAEILRLARTAPSGANLQPGHFHVLTGPALADLVAGLHAAIASGTPETSEYSYFPDPMPMILRRRQVAAAGRAPAELQAKGFLIGTPAELVEQLGRLAELGARRVMWQRFDLDDTDTLELMAYTVLPQL